MTETCARAGARGWRIPQLTLALATLVVAAPSALRAQAAGRTQAPTALPSIEEKTAGMQKMDGFFPLFYEESAGRLWLEIARFDTEVLHITGLAAGLGSNDIGLDRGILQ